MPILPERLRNLCQTSISGLVRRRAISSFISLVLAGLVVLAAPPTFTYTKQLIGHYYGDRANEFYQAGDFARAVLYRKRSIQLEPAAADSYYELGQASEKIGANDEALRAYEQAITLNHQFYDAYIAAAAVNIVKRKDYESAKKDIERALRQGPGEASVQYSLYTNLGRADIGLANWDQAQRNLRHAIQINPTRGSAHCLLAQLLESRSEGDRALSEWGLCAAMSEQSEVEASWREVAVRKLSAVVRP